MTYPEMAPVWSWKNSDSKADGELVDIDFSLDGSSVCPFVCLKEWSQADIAVEDLVGDNDNNFYLRVQGLWRRRN